MRRSRRKSDHKENVGVGQFEPFEAQLVVYVQLLLFLGDGVTGLLEHPGVQPRVVECENLEGLGAQEDARHLDRTRIFDRRGDASDLVIDHLLKLRGPVLAKDRAEVGDRLPHDSVGVHLYRRGDLPGVLEETFIPKVVDGLDDDEIRISSGECLQVDLRLRAEACDALGTFEIFDQKGRELVNGRGGGRLHIESDEHLGKDPLPGHGNALWLSRDLDLLPRGIYDLAGLASGRLSAHAGVLSTPVGC